MLQSSPIKSPARLSFRESCTCTTVPLAAGKPRTTRSRVIHITQAARWNWGPLERLRASDDNDVDEAFQQQQEILKRRRNKTWEGPVNARRAEVRKYNTDKAYREKVDAEKRARSQKEKDARAEATKGGIPFPMASFGIPEYDLGERFDLKGPYCDSGWVDEDADFFKQIGRFFGRKSKKADPETSEDTKRR